MSQSQLNHKVAAATGEDVEVIRRLGFSLPKRSRRDREKLRRQRYQRLLSRRAKRDLLTS